jgi:RHS repeat-associated protein
MLALAKVERSSSPLPLAAVPSAVSVTWPRPGYGNKAFTGREWDSETRLAYYRARYYDPRLGRFTSEDPIGLVAGPNLYTYVRNNPSNLVDPHGEVAVALPILAVIGVFLTVAVAIHYIQHPPPPLPPFPIPEDDPPPPPAPPTSGPSTGRSGAGTATSMSRPTTQVPPFPLPPNVPFAPKRVNCGGLLQACLGGFMTGPCYSCAQVCEASGRWPYEICHGPGPRDKCKR